jgi:hypothetical protein
MKMKPDVEVLFEFTGERKHSTRSGFRCPHSMTDTLQATGCHTYYDTDEVPAGGSALGTIAFLMPECYLQSMWVGKKIAFRDGRIIGYATVRRVLNPILEAKEG